MIEGDELRIRRCTSFPGIGQRDLDLFQSEPLRMDGALGA
jgi:hypothetical protein